MNERKKKWQLFNRVNTVLKNNDFIHIEWIERAKNDPIHMIYMSELVSVKFESLRNKDCDKSVIYSI